MRLLRTAVVALALALPTALLAAPAQAAASDPLRPHQWGLTRISADQAQTRSTGVGVVVAVIDTGVDLQHPDLRGRLVPGATFVGCPSTTSCGNGDWGGTAGTSAAQKELDVTNGHGTHVAGIIAAAGHNGVGIRGVAPHARIMPIKVLQGGEGSTDDISRGIRWAVDHGANVINMSLGGDGIQDQLEPLTQTMTPAVEYALAHGVVVVAAAGNSGPVPFCSTPANIAGVLCVSAVGPDGHIASYSQGGMFSADTVAAPGGAGTDETCANGVISTFPSDSAVGGGCGGDHYLVMNGTSMAAPHVAGIAALLLAQCRTATQTVAVIENTAQVPGDAGMLEQSAYGHGLVDAQRAVTAAGAACTRTPPRAKAALAAGGFRVVRHGERLTVRVPVTNRGDATSPRVTLVVRVAGRTVAEKTLAPIAPGKTRPVTLKVPMRKSWKGRTKTWSVVVGGHTVRQRVKVG